MTLLIHYIQACKDIFKKEDWFAFYWKWTLSW